MGWTDERVATLKKLWLDGLSASQIAKQLGGVTRNAVIGKLHRLGLNGRGEASAPTVSRTQRQAKPARIPRPAAVHTMPRRPQTRASEPACILNDSPGSATIFTLGKHMCKWPIGDPSSDSFTYCGSDLMGNRTFCPRHATVAYQPQQSRTRSGGNELARALRRYI